MKNNEIAFYIQAFGLAEDVHFITPEEYERIYGDEDGIETAE